MLWSSILRQSNPNDTELREDRIRRALPWSINPFTAEIDPRRAQRHEKQPLAGDEDDPSPTPPLPIKQSLQSHLLPPPEFAWTDLMLDLAMATAFANLTENTKILTGLNAASYLAFFALVFWIWASNVAYNVRYRQHDWLHRLYAFFQLCVFAALSAFTASFDAANGISDTGDDEKLQAALIAGGDSQDDINAWKASRDRLPILNSAGISMVMGLSRVLLLIAYVMVFYHAGRLRNKTLIVSLVTLPISAAMYFIAFGISNAGIPGYDVVKLVLWYTPILLEVAGLYVESFMDDSVAYYTAPLWEKYSTLMTVIMAEGLNSITGAFHYIVGSLGFEASSAGAVISSIVIVFMLWILYFETGDYLLHGTHRSLSWVMLHFFFFCALILLLEAMRNIIQSTNLVNAINFVINTIDNIANADSDTIEAALNSLNDTLGLLGFSLNDVATDLQNAGDKYGNDGIQGKLLQWVATLQWTILQQFDALPDLASPVRQEYYNFVDPNNVINDTIVNNNSSLALYVSLVSPHLQSTTWFYSTAGAVLIFLALLNVVQNTPSDKYAWGSFLSRLLLGIILALLSLLDTSGGGSTAASSLGNQLIWSVLGSGWLLPSLAIMLLMLAVIDYVLLYLSTRPYRDAPFKSEETSAS